MGAKKQSFEEFWEKKILEVESTTLQSSQESVYPTSSQESQSSDSNQASTPKTKTGSIEDVQTAISNFDEKLDLSL